MSKKKKSKGILEFIRGSVKTDAVTWSPTGALTLKDLEDCINELAKNHKPREWSWELVAYDYPTLSDDEFRCLCATPGARFVGGMEGVTRMQARCKKLGIKINE